MVSLGSRLNRLIMLAMLPPVLVLLASSIYSYHQRRQHAQAEAELVNNFIAGRFAHLTGLGGRFLRVAAQFKEVRAGSRAECTAFLSRVMPPAPPFIGTVKVDAQGNVLCSNYPLKDDVNVSAVPGFAAAWARSDTTVLPVIRNLRTGTPVLAVTRRFAGEAGEAPYMLAMGVDPAWASAAMVEHALPESYTMTVLDAQGRVFMHYPDPQDWIGRATVENGGQPILSLDAMRRRLDALIGADRLFTVSDIGVPGAPLYAALSQSRAIAYAPANHYLALSLAAILLGGIGFMAATRTAARGLIQRQFGHLVATARQLGQGDLGQRARLDDPPEEFAQLAEALNGMAQALEARDGDLRKLSLVASSSTNAVFIADCDFRFEYVNQAFADALATTVKACLGRTPVEVAPLAEEQRRLILQARRQLLAGEATQVDWQSYRKDGARVWMSYTLQPVIDNHGRTTQFVGIGTDITERKTLAENLLRAEEIASIGHWQVDVATGTLTCSEQISRSLGLSHNQTAFDLKRVLQIYHPDDRAFVRAAFEETVANGTPLAYERRIIDPAGEIRYLRVKAECDLDENGKVRRVFGVSQDITEAKEAEAALLMARAEAERASKMKTDFLATMSHEIRTPMNGVLGMADLLKETPLNAEQRRYVDTIVLSGKGLLTLINDILDLSKLEAGRVQLEKEPFSIAGLMDEVLALMSVNARKKGLVISQSYANDLPDVVIGDIQRLRQVLVNLIGNAIKFTAEGRIDIAVTALAEREDARLCLEFKVSDTGIGVPEDKQAALFQKFTQADASTTRQFGGSGLGLSICRELVELMGGEIWLTSRPGKGATFAFTILAEPYDGDGLAVGSGAGESVPEASDIPPLRVLVVEDNAINRMLINTMLRKMGHQVETAVDGLDAIYQMRSAAQPFDVVLMDINMPRMDGLVATGRIRALGGAIAKTPVVALTANAMDGDRERYLAAGMDGYLSKPLDRADLLRLLARIAAGGKQASVPRPAPPSAPASAPKTHAPQPAAQPTTDSAQQALAALVASLK
ncbi:MAG: ATP-binding protein [Pseudomonadota bacterium]